MRSAILVVLLGSSLVTSAQVVGSGVFSGSKSGSSNPVIPTGYCAAPGMKCDGVTDDTAAFQSLLNTTAAAGGGVIQGTAGKTSLLLGQITIPSAATTPWAMSPLRIIGSNASFGGSDQPTVGAPGTPFTLDLRFAGSRILSLGQGVLEIDHVNLINGGSSCGVFLQTTLTNVKLHDNSIFGNTATGGLSACDDVWIAGGTNGTNLGLNGSINDYFQGYGSVIRDNHADYIRSFVIGRVAFNSIPVVNNVIFNHSGSNVTTAVSAATNANPVVLTSTAHSFPTGTGVTLTFSGFTGAWTSLNGAQAITVIDANTFSVAINSTAFGALTGSPVYLSGSAISIDGTAAAGSNFADSGNEISGNLIEQTNYPFAYRLGSSNGNHITGTSCWDAGSASIACAWQQSAAASNFIQINRSGSSGVLSTGPSPFNGSLIFVGAQSQSTLPIVLSGTSNGIAWYGQQPNLPTGGQISAQLQKDSGNFDGGSFFFKNQGGVGSTSNRFGLFMQGVAGLVFLDGLGTWNVSQLITTKVTVATLPTASSLTAGTMVEVTDSNGTPGTCTGGGSSFMIAITNGSSWSCH